ncbi:nucleotidyltransferase family protein [Luteibacter sp. PPL552]
MTARHDAVLLAAGGSRRLGHPKQMLTVGGETLLVRAARLLAATGPGRLVVVLGAHADALASWLDEGIVRVNPDWRDGMASSLQVAARALDDRERPVLVAVVDQPALDAMHLARLLAAYDGRRDVVTAYGDARGVPAVVRASTLRRAPSLQGDQGLRALWAGESPLAVRADALERDIDTPGDVDIAMRDGLLDPARG